MTPDDLLLPPAKQAQLAALLASAGIADGLQQCIDEAAAQVEDYTEGYSLSATRLAGWTRTLALHLAYTRAAVGVPDFIKDAADNALSELRDVRDGKFNVDLNPDSPAKSPGLVVTEESVLTESMR